MFTDSHYSSKEITCGDRYNSRSLEKIRKAYEHFKEQSCELVIILGDLTDKEESHEKELANLKQISSVISDSGIKTVCVMGNHDGFAYDEDEFYGVLEGCRPQNMTANGVNLVFIDACHRSDGKHYTPGDSDWTDTFYPYTDELEKHLRTVNGDTYVFMHQNIDGNVREDHRVHNASEIRSILEKSGKVKCVYQGHYHYGLNSSVNGIEYVTLRAMCCFDDAFCVIDL